MPFAQGLPCSFEPRVEDEPLVHRHFLVVLLTLENKCIQAFLKVPDFSIVESVGLRILGVYFGSVWKYWEACSRSWNRYELLRKGLADVLLASWVVFWISYIVLYAIKW